MEGGHGRDAELADEVEDVLAVVATPCPEVELDRDDLDARGEGAGRAGVVRSLVPPDPVMDLERKGRSALRREEDGDLAVTGRGCQVAREGRDAATPRGITGDERGSRDA